MRARCCSYYRVTSIVFVVWVRAEGCLVNGELLPSTVVAAIGCMRVLLVSDARARGER